MSKDELQGILANARDGVFNQWISIDLQDTVRLIGRLREFGLGTSEISYLVSCMMDASETLWFGVHDYLQDKDV